MTSPLHEPGRRALLVAQTGGHLRELHELRPRLPFSDVTWLTFDEPQARALLLEEQVHHLHWTGTRDLKNTLRNLRRARRYLRLQHYDAVVSTGAAVAMSVLPLARAYGLSCHYVESATRQDGPSVTGRLLARTPGVHLYTQAPGWADEDWSYRGSVFDSFSAAPRQQARLEKVVVTLGTMRQFGFRSAVERLLQVLPPEADVLWQTGHTDVSGLGIEAHPVLPADLLQKHVREADVVIAHAGVGSSLDALAAGQRPLLLPRRASRGEHVDDHQEAIGLELAARGLAVMREAPDVGLEDLLEAAGSRVVRTPGTPFVLNGLESLQPQEQLRTE